MKKQAPTFRTSVRMIEQRFVLTDKMETIGVSVSGDNMTIYSGREGESEFKDVLLVSKDRLQLRNLGKLISWASGVGTDDGVKRPVNFTYATENVVKSRAKKVASPKASVEEFMVDAPAKKKRGRPFGSKNKKKKARRTRGWSLSTVKVEVVGDESIEEKIPVSRQN